MGPFFNSIAKVGDAFPLDLFIYYCYMTTILINATQFHKNNWAKYVKNKVPLCTHHTDTLNNIL